MSATDGLALANFMVAFLGVAFALFAFWEWRSLRKTREEFDRYQSEQQARSHKAQKAMQRILASYQINDTDKKISLLKSVVEIDPKAFNLYNALGYAYLEKDDQQAAIDAFQKAVQQHPNDKEGYFDLASLYHEMGRQDMVQDYLETAVSVDPTSKADMKSDARFAEYLAD